MYNLEPYISFLLAPSHLTPINALLYTELTTYLTFELGADTDTLLHLTHLFHLLVCSPELTHLPVPTTLTQPSSPSSNIPLQFPALLPAATGMRPKPLTGVPPTLSASGQARHDHRLILLLLFRPPDCIPRPWQPHTRL
jgi:hypothetical protein